MGQRPEAEINVAAICDLTHCFRERAIQAGVEEMEDAKEFAVGAIQILKI